MSYGTHASKLTTSSSNLSNKKSSISNLNLDSSWEGNAANKQIEHIQKLSDETEKVINDLKTLAAALQEIDNYDNYKNQKSMWQNELNNIPSEETERRQNARNNLADASRRLNETKSSINQKLNSISSSYSSQIEIIPPTEVETTNDVFANVFVSSSGIEQSFEISQYVKVNYSENPNFTNTAAWVSENPYSQAGLYGQCTWFAWGKFYEMYGYSPGFTGNGNQCAYQLVNSHPDKFEISNTPKAGAVFSYKGYPYGHTGVITEVKDGMLTYQDGNYDGVTNTFAVAQKDWGTRTVPVQDFINRYGGNIVFANPKTYSA